MWGKKAFCGFEKKSVDKKAKWWMMICLKSYTYIKYTEKSTEFFQNCSNLLAKTTVLAFFVPGSASIKAKWRLGLGRKSEV